MNREIKLQPFSALFGLAIGVLALVCMSQVMAPTIPTHRVECGPHPRDMVQIREGTTFTVPAGKILAFSGLGNDDRSFSTQPYIRVRLKINGQSVSGAYLSTTSSSSPPATPMILQLPPGLTAQCGDVVEVATAPNYPPGAIACGYLADK